MKTRDPKKKSTKAAAGTKKVASKKKTVITKVKAEIKAKPKATVSKVAAKIEDKAEIKAKPKATVSKVAAIKPKPAVKTEKKAPKKKAVIAKVVAKIEDKAKVKAKIENKAKVKAKAEIKAKPKATVSKVAAIKPKPAVKTEKKAPKKKAVIAKVVAKIEDKAKVKAKAGIKAKLKATVSKVAAIKPKPAVKAEKKVPEKKAVIAKVAAKIENKAKAKAGIKAKPKATVSKVAAIKPKPAVKAGKKAVAAKKELAVPLKSSLKPATATIKNKTVRETTPNTERHPAIYSKARLKIFLPAQELSKEETEEIFFGELPEEYGENSVIALAVDPNTVFVDWEIIPKDISDKDGDLNLRFYDITGIEFNEWNTQSILDVQVNKRVGSGFFDIRMPGRDVVVAVGILSRTSGFMPIARSETVSFPELLTFDELGIVQKLFESGIPVGY